MRDYEREAIAEAAYQAWSSGRNYDAAWDRAEAAIERYEPCDYDEAECVATSAALRAAGVEVEDDGGERGEG